MKKIFLILSTTLLLSVALKAQTEKTTGTLTFNVTGFLDNSGQVIVKLYRKNDEIPENSFRQVKAEIKNYASVVEIKDLPYGDYGAIIVHDKNGNGIIDHSWGIPAEPLGYTNNWQLSLFSGMPTFEKLKFTFCASNSKCNISVK